MAERRKGVVAGWIAVGIGAAAGATYLAQRAIAMRDRARPDPFANEPYGMLGGTPIGPAISLDATSLHVAAEGSGRPIVFVHGFSLNRTLWHHQIQDLADGARVVVYDQRGHGLSERAATGDYSLDALAVDLWTVLRHIDARDAIVVGHSMGGMAALKFCELYPEELGQRVAGLMLVATTAADVMTGPLKVSLGRRASAAMQMVQEGAMRAVAGRARQMDTLRARSADTAYLATRVMGFGRAPAPSQVAFVERMLAEVPSEVWLSLLPGLMSFDVREVLGTISIPTSIMVGERDRLTPPGAAQRIADVVPGAELVVLPDAGHTPMLEAHEVFTKHLREFTAEVARA